MATSVAVQNQHGGERKLCVLWHPLVTLLIYLAAGNSAPDGSGEQWREDGERNSWCCL